jgi:hypothetical protein
MLTVSSYNKNYVHVKTMDKIPLACPLCKHAGEVNMSFYQIQTENSASINTTKQISGICFCMHCKEEIPNVRWDDIYQRFFANEKKNIHLKTSFQMKRGGKIALRILATMFILFGVLFLVAFIIHLKNS